jgi:bifunctional enzyme CysN/CysC
VAEAARLFVDAGLIVLVSFISPFRSERRMARELAGAGEFIEIFVDTPIEVCMRATPRASTQGDGRRDQEFHRHRQPL